MLIKIFFCLILSIFNFNFSNAASMSTPQNEIMYSPSSEIQITNLDQYEGAYESINNYLTLNLNVTIHNENISRVKVIKEESFNQIDNLVLDREYIEVNQMSNFTFSISLRQFKEKNCVTYLYFYDYSKDTNEEFYFSKLGQLVIYSYRMNQYFFISFSSPSTVANYAFQYYGITNYESNIIETTEIFPNESLHSSEFDGLSIIKGKFLIKTRYGTYHPATGIKVKLVISYEFGNPLQQYVLTDEVYINDSGLYLFETPRLSFLGNVTNIQLFFYSQTEYTIVRNDEAESSTTYCVETNISYIMSSENNELYSHRISDIKTNYASNIDYAFNIAVGLNAAGDFCKNIANIKNIPSVTCVYPDKILMGKGGGANFNGIDEIHITDDNKDAYLHEYGHFILKAIGAAPSKNAGGGHSEKRDLAIMHAPDYEYGYRMAWSEGFATYFSNIVQKTYDYSWLCDRWTEEYYKFKMLNLDNENFPFPLRESNERTVTNILLAISDANFKYSNAMEIDTLFAILQNSGNIDRLSDLFYILNSDNYCNKDMLNNCMNFYYLAPYRLNSQEEIIKKNENFIFSWYNGNSLRLDDSDYPYYDVSNTDFTFRLYNSENGTLVYEISGIESATSSKETSISLSNTIINTIFLENKSLTYYWNVQGRDFISSNKQYIYTSENYIVHLDGFKFNSINTIIERNDLSNLKLSSNVEYVYNEEEKKYLRKFHLYYCWESLPNSIIQDAIILSWRVNVDIAAFHSADYYDNNVLITSSNNFSEQRISNYGVKQIYWYANKSVKATNTYYGETTITFDSNEFSNIIFVFEYHHFTNTATAMKGVFVENDSYTTSSYLQNIVQLYYDNLV